MKIKRRRKQLNKQFLRPKEKKRLLNLLKRSRQHKRKQLKLKQRLMLLRRKGRRPLKRKKTSMTKSTSSS